VHTCPYGESLCASDLLILVFNKRAMEITRYKIFVGHESLRAFFCYFILTDARKDSCATYFRMGHSVMADLYAAVLIVATRIFSCDIALNREKVFLRYVL
jgi:hypothetical protein